MIIQFASRTFFINPSCKAIRKLSGLAVPSCCCGSSQRAAMLVCQASVSLPCGTTVAALLRECPPRKRGNAGREHATPA